MLHHGIDLHEHTLVIGTVDASGRVLKQKRMPTRRTERLAYLDSMRGPHRARFPSVRHFFSYCRLVPGTKNSGGKQRHKRSREGNPYLKNAFRNVGIRAVQNEPVIKAWYQKKVRKKGKPIAQALVAKEIARIVYHVLRDEVDFNGTFKGVPIENPKPAVWPRRASPDA